MTQTKAELINGKGDVTFDTNTLFIDAVNNRVGIGTTSPGIVLEVFKGTFPDFQLKDTAGRIHRLAINSDAADPKAAFISDSPWVWQTSGGAERARIDSSGRLLVGTSTARSNFYNSTISAGVQIEGTTGDAASLAIIADRSGAPPKLILAASGGSTIGSNAVVASGNGAGSISFQASDGTEFVQLAEINADVDGTPGANDMPGRLVFSTTADGASSPTERMRITSGGFAKHSNNGTYNNATANYHEFYSTINDQTIWVTCSNTSHTESIFQVNAHRTANSAYNFLRAYSGNLADLEFNLRGDGNAFADGTWTGGGADYAEYFEWSDGNPTEADRRGISVVLDGDKIREAQAGEDPIGVISGNPSIVGDAAWNKWSGKYLRDEFGTYLLDESGDRQLNPAYDPDVEYTPREQRPEWDCVGLMGKLRIRKGQVTGSRWIKMRDISDSVEEWLVR